jgi:hypothetical protein
MVFNVTLIHAQSYAKSWHMSVLPDPHQKKSFAKYICRTYSWWQIALIPAVHSSGMTYANMDSVPVEKHNIYDKYNHLFPSGALAFNTVWTALHTLRERIHVLRKWPQDIPRSTCPSCTVVTSRMMYTQPLPHDRDCPQTNLVLRGWVWDLPHPVGGYLPSYLFIGVSLQNSKLQKVNPY